MTGDEEIVKPYDMAEVVEHVTVPRDEPTQTKYSSELGTEIQGKTVEIHRQNTNRGKYIGKHKCEKYMGKEEFEKYIGKHKSGKYM